MKILVMNGSLRKNGNTERLLHVYAEELQKAGKQFQIPLELEIVPLRDYRIEPCRGCRTCFDRGEGYCPIQDDIPALIERMRAADGVLFACPVYVNDVNGAAKNWIDRLAYACHRPDFTGKYAFLAATVGTGPTASHALTTLGYALASWGYSVTGKSGFIMGALMEREDVGEKFRKQIARDARKFLRSVQRQMHLKPSFMSLMIFNVQQGCWRKAKDASFDYTWWKARGWLEPGVVFYYPVKSNPVKVGFAGWAGAVVRLFLK